MVFSLAFMPLNPFLRWYFSQGAIFQQKCRNVQSDGGERGQDCSQLTFLCNSCSSISQPRGFLGKACKLMNWKIVCSFPFSTCVWYMKSSPTATRKYPPQVPVSCECYFIWKKRAFVSVIMLRILRGRCHSGLFLLALSAITSVLTRGRRGRF